jgi:mono/diheme cytochrome c family protein
MLMLAVDIASGAVLGMDSARGERLFSTLSCMGCHSLNGQGGKIGPDLGRRIDRNFTPASLAATMWNHAPTMWSAMRERNVRAGDLNEQAAADLFAYFYSVRFFNKPGDAGRGKRLFSSKHCADCHGLTEAKLPEAKPVSHWESIGHPVDLVDAMWNHAARMRQEFARRNLPWAELTAQDLDDMLVYLRNLPSRRNVQAGFVIASGARGQALYESKGCASCHTGKLGLASRLKNRTLTDIAAAMWNHEPKMAENPPQFTEDEMRELVSYLWAGQFFRDEGNPSAGERVFTSKHCAACHNNPSSGVPKLTGSGRSFTAATMVSSLWYHGPRMLGEMNSKGIRWPRFEGREMANLIAYLNARDGGK